jgi:hypothetical protein
MLKVTKKKISKLNGNVYISHIMVDGKVIGRGDIIKRIENGEVFYTSVNGEIGEKIHIVKRKNGGEFISTNPNETTGDNLGSLPDLTDSEIHTLFVIANLRK